ncbi:Sodium/hydrogen exchanger [Amniculicola lignicola CBS 123094]|uniref:Sodium/hydrogen exchanger n=1 Tax=Amniculicola lignicola CBS 123094 TaxID=1392246 RepID=A0A6A5WRE4_9PLEO|nr:Sodium/hydrogen exchanger [Amniculicola lignicola CBS 123094]
MAAAAAAAASSMPYHEPDIVTILVQTSFLLLLNLVNAALDRLVYCGLLGQVLIGIAWGTPGAKWLPSSAEELVVQLGYLGLILLVYEGGLSTSFTSLKANLLLSSAVAITGIGMPIALSFFLQELLDATSLQVFAAGAALCSTSLGTTFTVLRSSGLASTRLGVVLSSAAMMDDVVGLVMVEVISNLGGGSIGPLTVVRPILVSLAFAIVVPLTCHFLVSPLTLVLNRYREAHAASRLSSFLRHRHTILMNHTLLLIALVTGSTYAGTSNLFAAYIAGAMVSWWDTELPHPAFAVAVATEAETVDEKTNRANAAPSGGCIRDPNGPPTLEDEADILEVNPTGAMDTGIEEESSTSGTTIFEHYYYQPLARILQPFFFASIGFSIPITHMFNGQIVWRGFVYAILMTLAKLVCGLWLVRFSVAPAKEAVRGVWSMLKIPNLPHLWGRTTATTGSSNSNTHSGGQANAQSSLVGDPRANKTQLQSPAPPKPFSLQPPLMLALAMVSRGEIGFLISSVAESRGVFASPGSNSNAESDIFLVVTWAIVLCTIVGPLGVGLCVRRVKALEERKNSEQEGAGRDVLGVWGVR